MYWFFLGFGDSLWIQPEHVNDWTYRKPQNLRTCKGELFEQQGSSSLSWSCYGLPQWNTGWPRKNATLTITNIKKIRDLIKLVSALMSRTFFFLQNDTKINEFDEGVLILEPFFWGNVIFKFCSFCIKSHIWGREEYLWVAPLDCNAA